MKWKNYSITDFAEIVNHKRVPVAKRERLKMQGEYPYYGASGVVDHVNGFVFEGKHVLISEDGENLRSRKTPIAFIADNKFWVNNHAHILVPKKPEFAELLVHYFANLDLTPFITGAVQPKLNKANLLRIPIRLPEEENGITELINTIIPLQDKIDLLRQQNETLEALGAAVFREWFLGGDWHKASLYDQIELIGGGTPKTSEEEFWGGEIGWLSGGDIASNHKGYVSGASKSVTKEGVANSSAKLLPRSATIISARGTVGKYCLLAEPMTFSQSNYGVMPADGTSFYFTYLLIDHAVDRLLSAAYGSVFDTITTRTFKNLKLPAPPVVEVQKFEQKVSSFFEKMETNTKSINKLIESRDLLLPKLMSGKVKIAE